MSHHLSTVGRAKSWARGLLIEVDETPIGTFVELEGPPAAIDRAATELGYSKRDYIVTNYLSLYVEDCRRKVGSSRKICCSQINFS